MTELTHYTEKDEAGEVRTARSVVGDKAQKDGLFLKVSKHPIIVATFGFVLVGVFGGTIQQNYQRKNFALERQLLAIEQIIENSLIVQRNIRVLTDESGLVTDLSPSERSLRLETRHLVDAIAVDFDQTSPLRSPREEISEIRAQYRNAIACVGAKLDRLSPNSCRSHIVFDASDAVVFSGRIKREFLDDTFESVSALSYLESLFGI
ncbi:MAG: hypothetical protein AAF577_15945 [Pseudomonadota bacterium]